MFENVYKNKKVLITGATGFKGSRLALWFHLLGAEVLGYSLEPDTEPALFNILKLDNLFKNVYGNILNAEETEKTFNDFKPDFVFHLAAQPIVRKSYFEPVLTYKTNVIGTLNVLEAARKCGSVKAFVNVTTDKCYKNKALNTGYREDDELGGSDMYSSSKSCVEIMSESYRKCFLENSYAMATVRAGNVIGGGDWGEDRLVPDCMRAINSDCDIKIRNPYHLRPWQFVLEPLFGYIKTGEALYLKKDNCSGAFNFAPDENSVISVGEVVEKVISLYGKGRIKIIKKDNLKEEPILKLNGDKAKKYLGMSNIYDIDTALKKTVGWYKKFYENKGNMFDYTVEEIREYENDLQNKKTEITVSGAEYEK